MRFRTLICTLLVAKALLFTAASRAQASCSTVSGTRFNLEPASFAVPQNEPPVDFILNGVAPGNDLVVQTGNDFRYLTHAFNSYSGIYVHRDTTSTCSPTFEAASPPIPDPLFSGGMMHGGGNNGADPQVLADTNLHQFIFSDLRTDYPNTAVGVRRVPAANLLNSSMCPAGTQTAAQAVVCLSSNGAAAVIVDEHSSGYDDFDKLAQDPRPMGTATGAGDIYTTETYYTTGASASIQINLTACKATFVTAADCSTSVKVSGTDGVYTSTNNGVHFSSVSVVPAGPNAGAITITYMQYPTSGQVIRFVTCTPHGAPNPPTCSAPTTITSPSPSWVYPTSSQSRSLTGMTIVNYTIPVVINRVNPAGLPGPQTTFVFYETCGASRSIVLNAACPDANISMAWSNDLGATWQIGSLDATRMSHEFMPAATVDTAQNIVNVAYYKSARGDIYKNRVQVYLAQIPSGSTTPGNPIALTTLPDSPDGDANLPFEPQYGDYIGVAAHGSGGAGNSRVYVGHTNNSRLGFYYNGATNTESNNHVSSYAY